MQANASGNTHNYYIFAEEAGLSKFGTYYGDGTDDDRLYGADSNQQ